MAVRGDKTTSYALALCKKFNHGGIYKMTRDCNIWACKKRPTGNSKVEDIDSIEESMDGARDPFVK